ncbi:hypothetical protein SD70_31280 [Gordoniibacillus kamchatkensis]|uniref:N-acetyltransferase domain-containing protein n=1 Tax=Gordoniibacillus kamchatkensis TaxID=1590651 RepID=A0ABR5A6V1_9BACL|nr:hypothetical protein SD70_31280 [Paenibacillus sp. VKM B-2647]
MDSYERYSGDCVYLRLLTELDTDALLAFRTQNRDFLRPFEPAQADEHFTKEHVRSLLSRWTAEREADASYSFGIFESGSEQLAGTIRLSGIVRGAFQNAMLGYALAENLGGQGRMTEAVRLILEIAFGPLQLHRVQANAMPRNVRSLRVLEKNGFRREGYAPRYLCINGGWEDHICCAITVEDYEIIRFGRFRL